MSSSGHTGGGIERTADLVRPGRFALRASVPAPAWGFAVTAGLALVCLGVLVGSDVLLHPERGIVGWNPASDYQIMTWSLSWWPWAIGHGVDPLHTHLLWAPGGFPTLWITAIPALALIALPLTLTLGPLLAYNALMFAAVGLAAGCAYLLCRELTGRTAPAVVGGLMFGLSPYMVGHTLSQHLNLTWVWPIPLVAWAIVRRFRDRWPNTRTFVAALAVLLVVELGTSLEVFLDLTLVLCIAFLVAVAGPVRHQAIRTAMSVAAAYAVCLPLVGAVAYLALTTRHGALAYPPVDYSTDAVNVVVPTQLTLLGAWHPLRGLSRHFVGNIGEQDGYLGLPVIALVVLAARATWRQGAWFAVALLGVLLLLSLGPVLTVQGRPVAGLPFSTARAPVLADILPARMSAFAMLVAACLVSVWLALERRVWLRAAVAVLVLASLLPNVALSGRIAGAWALSDVARFSTERAPAGFSLPGKNVLVLPTGDRTPAMYWQARSHMGFRLALPGTPFVPQRLVAEPTVIGLLDETLPFVDGERLAAARLRAYLAQERIDAVAVTPEAAPRWRRIAAEATDARPRRSGSALVYDADPRLPGLHATGEVASAGPLVAWIRYDGRRGHVAVKLGAAPAVGVSAPSGDAEQTAAAVGVGGRAAVLFTEWHGDTLLVRAATHDPGGRWRVTTIDRRTQPVWSPRVLIAPGGTTVATWVDEVQPLRLVRAAARPAGGRWQDTVTLDHADGLASAELAAAGGSVLLAWHDSLANEQRVRVATYRTTGWRSTRTVGTSMSIIRGLRIAGSVVEWRSGGDLHREETR